LTRMKKGKVRNVYREKDKERKKEIIRGTVTHRFTDIDV
jgi:hypothetical protein